MIDEKKIKEAAILHLTGIEDNLQDSLADACMPHDEINDIEDFITDAFYVGAQWAQQKFLKELWHDAEEEPHVGSPLIGHDVDGFSIYSWRAQENTWEEFFGNCGLLKWCYISELLSSSAS